MATIEHQLEKLENLAQLKQKELDRENYEKYIGLYKPAIEFLRKQDVLMYGGMALNEIFPKELKFYDDAILPDIDIFTTNAIALCLKLVEYFKKRGFPNASYKRALHVNTYKFYLSGLQLLDITDVSEDTFKRLKKGRILLKTGLKIPIVNRDYLRFSLHALLSQPKDSHRWGKTFDRLRKFYELFPPKPKICKSKTKMKLTSWMNEMTEDLLYLVKETPYVVFGGFAMTKLIDGLALKQFSLGTCMDIIVEGETIGVATQFLQKLQEKYGSDDLSISSVYPSNELTCEHQFILFRDKPIVGFYRPQMCVSFVSKKMVRIASLHTISRMYMMLAMSAFSHHDKMNYSCLTELITYLQVKLMRDPKKKVLMQQFALECYGEQPGLITLRRNVFDGKP